MNKQERRKEMFDKLQKDMTDRIIGNQMAQALEVEARYLTNQPLFPELIDVDVDNIDFSRKPLGKTSLTGLTKEDIDEVLK